MNSLTKEGQIRVFLEACEKGDIKTAKRLFENDVYDNKGMFLACKSGNVALVKLFASRINLAIRENDALITACFYGHLRLVKFLLADSRIVAAGLVEALEFSRSTAIENLVRCAQYGIGGEKYKEIERKMKNSFD